MVSMVARILSRSLLGSGGKHRITHWWYWEHAEVEPTEIHCRSAIRCTISDITITPYYYAGKSNDIYRRLTETYIKGTSKMENVR